MSFWDDFLPVLGTVGGAVVGTYFGNPMLGASLGGKLGQAGAGLADSASGPDANSMSAAQIKAYQDLYGQLPTYQGLPVGQGLSPADKFAFEQARRQAQGFAQGREGALEQNDAAMSGGASRQGKLLGAQQQASQAGAERLNMFDLGQGGIASERDLQNRQMLNQFNQQNMMMKLGITGGMVGAENRAQTLGMANNAANQGNLDNLFSGLGSFALRNMYSGKDGTNPASVNGGQGSPYWSGYGMVGDEYGSPGAF